tara:strand:+ start:4791 stop:8621 length:3831 start_codon:yes stop_codon:yes gene_type:complete
MSRSSQYKNDMSAYGDFLPRVYIDKIVLRGREDQGADHIGVEVRLAVKDTGGPSGNYLLFDNPELWDLINIDIIVMRDSTVAEKLIAGELDISTFAYAPLWPEEDLSDIPSALFTQIIDGTVSSDYWRVRIAPGEGTFKGGSSWLQPSQPKVAWRTINLGEAISDIIGREHPMGLRDRREALIDRLPDITESGDNSFKTIKVLEGESMNVRMKIHKNFFHDVVEGVTGFLDSAHAAELYRSGGASMSAVSDANLFPGNLHVFAYSRLRRDTTFWSGTGLVEGGLDNLANLPKLHNEFLGEVAYEHMIQGGLIKTREFKFFTEDDKLWQDDVMLNKQGDYVKALNFNNEKVANEISERVLSLINTDTETENEALLYYSYIVSNLVGYATSERLFVMLYDQLSRMPNRLTNTNAGKLAMAFSNLMEQFYAAYTTSERVYRKSVRNPKYLDLRVRAAASGCAPSGYHHFPEGCVAPDGQPTPHSAIFLAGELPSHDMDFDGERETTPYDFVEREGELGLEGWWSKKRINGYFLLNVENMLHKREYHPTDNNYILVTKLLHHFGWELMKVYFFIDRLRIHRALCTPYTGDTPYRVKSDTEEKVVLAQLTHPASLDPGDGTSIMNIGAGLDSSILSPYLTGYEMATDGSGTPGDSYWNGTKNITEQLGLHMRREIFAPFGEDVPLGAHGYPSGPGASGTGLFFDATHPHLPGNPNKISKLILCYFSEPIVGMFGARDATDSVLAGTVNYNHVILQYRADYTVVNNIGGICFKIWEQLKTYRKTLEAYLAFAERTCSFDDRTGKFNEHFGDDFHRLFYKNLEFAWWVRPISLHILASDILHNTYGGSPALMREQLLNQMQGIDPNSGTIDQLRSYVENYNRFVHQWYENFKGPFNETSGKHTWYKNFTPREDTMSTSDRICGNPMVHPYGYSGFEGMSLPMGVIDLEDTFGVYNDVMDDLETERFAREQARVRHDQLLNCGGVRPQMMGFAAAMAQMAFNSAAPTAPNWARPEHTMGYIINNTHPSVSPGNVSSTPTDNSGIDAPPSTQNFNFRTEMERGFTGAMSLPWETILFGTDARGVGSEGQFGIKRGGWENYIRDALQGMGASSLGIERWDGQRTDPSTAPTVNDRKIAYDHQLIRERIRYGLKNYVEQLMYNIKTCTGLDSDEIKDSYMGGAWPFKALGNVGHAPTGENPEGSGGWGTINREEKVLINEMLDALDNLRAIGFWPFFDRQLIAPGAGFGDATSGYTAPGTGAGSGLDPSEGSADPYTGSGFGSTDGV